MAEDRVKIVDSDVSKPSIQVMPKAATPAKPSQSSSSLSSLNSAAFSEAKPAQESNCDNLFAKASNMNSLQNINNTAPVGTASPVSGYNGPPAARNNGGNPNW